MTRSNPLIAEELAADPRIMKTKRQLLEIVAEYQKKLTHVRSGDPNRKASYTETIEKFSQCRGFSLWFPYLGSGFGKGPLVELMDGSIKYDLITGVGCHYFGHSHPEGGQK